MFVFSAATNHQTHLSACFRYHDREKCQMYEQRVCETERGSFTPLVLKLLTRDLLHYFLLKKINIITQ